VSDLAMTESEDAHGLDVQDLGIEKGARIVNGIRNINGLTSRNGLISKNGLRILNGLSLKNGLTSVNGLLTMNGLATKNGFQTVDGKFVNCFGKADSTCTSPDGLLSRTTGLMQSSEGVITAEYLVRCALNSSDEIRIQKYDGTFASLKGQLGVAPEWRTGSCSTACEEKVSACMLAMLNQAGLHQSITMTAGWAGNPFGTSHTEYDVVEGSFFGNIFKSDAQAYVVSGIDHADSVKLVRKGWMKSVRGLAQRSCNADLAATTTYAGFLKALPTCSVTLIGTSAPKEFAWPAIEQDPNNYDKCSFASTDAGHGGKPSKSTALACSGPGTAVRNFSHVITTWQRTNQWIDSCRDVPEGGRALVNCAAGNITKIHFASYGNAGGVCGGYTLGSCHAASTAAKLAACVGKDQCVIDVNNDTFGGDPCPGTRKRLAVSYSCEN